MVTAMVYGSIATVATTKNAYPTSSPKPVSDDPDIASAKVLPLRFH